MHITCTPAVARDEYVVHAACRVRGDVGRGGVAHLVRVRAKVRVRMHVRMKPGPRVNGQGLGSIGPRWRRAHAGTGGSGCCRGQMRP